MNAKAPSPGMRLWLWAPVAIYMGAIYAVSAQSDPPGGPSLPDKPLHALAYAGLGVLAFRAVAGGLPARVTARRAAAALAITIGYGITDEIHQMFVPGRTPELYDLVADAAGASIGLIACGAWDIIRRSPADV